MGKDKKLKKQKISDKLKLKGGKEKNSKNGVSTASNTAESSTVEQTQGTAARPDVLILKDQTNTSGNVAEPSDQGKLSRLAETDPSIFPEETVCLMKRSDTPSPVGSKGFRMSVDDPTIAHAVDPSRTAKQKKKVPVKGSYFSPMLWRKSKAGDSPHLITKKGIVADLPSPLSPNPGVTPPSSPAQPDPLPPKPGTPSLLERLRSNMTVRRDSADHPATQESIAKFGNMVNTIKVTNRISRTRARRVGVIGSPGSVVLPDSQFISQLYEGLPLPPQRVVIPIVGGERPSYMTQPGHVSPGYHGHVSPGYHGDNESPGVAGEESYSSPLSNSSFSQVTRIISHL